jgi:hypothetical protein
MGEDNLITAQTSKDFRIKEFEALRKEIDDRRKDQWTTERDVVLATVGIFWALATIGTKDLAAPLRGIIPLLWFSPLFVWLAGFSRWMDDVRLVEEIGKFIRMRELLLDPVEKGWEHYHLPMSKHSVTYLLRLLSWIFLLVIDIGAPLFVWRNS